MWRNNTYSYEPNPNDNKLITITDNNIDNDTDSEIKNFSRDMQTKAVDYSTEEVVYIIKNLFGSVQNILQYCGCGTYLLCGPTNSGKTFCIRALVSLAQCLSKQYELKPIRFTSLILCSSTDEISGDFAWAKPYLRKINQSDKILKDFMVIRKTEIANGSKRLGIEPSEYSTRFPMILIIDDFVGSLSGSTANSPIATLASKARHLGLYVFLLVQSIKQVGPGVRKNARAIIGFRLELSAIQDTLKEFYGVINNYEQARNILDHVSVTYRPVIFVLNWLLNAPEYNNITRRILLTPPFPSSICREIEWVDPNNDLLEEPPETEESDTVFSPVIKRMKSDGINNENV